MPNKRSWTHLKAAHLSDGANPANITTVNSHYKRKLINWV